MRVCGDASSLDPFSRTAANKLDDDKFKRHYESQFVNCDIRNFPMEVLGKFPVIMADPPWDIHMELPYGTMADEEMRRMNVQCFQDDGVIFLWVTGRAMELGRECLDIWGYRFVQELLWVKTTPVPTVPTWGPGCLNASCLNPARFDSDVRLYNAAAEAVMADHPPSSSGGIETADLYSFELVCAPREEVHLPQPDDDVKGRR
mgnify:CR=1 FL=1